MATEENEKKVGRPRMSLDHLPEDWKSIILEIAKEGGSDVECRC
jgi:hypothetical protein